MNKLYKSLLTISLVFSSSIIADASESVIEAITTGNLRQFARCYDASQLNQIERDMIKNLIEGRKKQLELILKLSSNRVSGRKLAYATIWLSFALAGFSAAGFLMNEAIKGPEKESPILVALAISPLSLGGMALIESLIRFIDGLYYKNNFVEQYNNLGLMAALIGKNS